MTLKMRFLAVQRYTSCTSLLLTFAIISLCCHCQDEYDALMECIEGALDLHDQPREYGMWTSQFSILHSVTLQFQNHLQFLSRNTSWSIRKQSLVFDVNSFSPDTMSTSSPSGAEWDLASLR